MSHATEHDALLAKYKGFANLYDPAGTDSKSTPGGHIHIMTQLVETAIQASESQTVFSDFAGTAGELSTAVTEVHM